MSLTEICVVAFTVIICAALAWVIARQWLNRVYGTKEDDAAERAAELEKSKLDNERQRIDNERRTIENQQKQRSLQKDAAELAQAERTALARAGLENARLALETVRAEAAAEVVDATHEDLIEAERAVIEATKLARIAAAPDQAANDLGDRTLSALKKVLDAHAAYNRSGMLNQRLSLQAWLGDSLSRLLDHSADRP